MSVKRLIFFSCLLFSRFLFAQPTIGMIGGSSGAPSTYAAFVELDSLIAAPVLFPPLDPGALIQSVGFNAFGVGLIGGQDFNDTAYAAFVNAGSGNVSLVSGLPPMTSLISSVAVNSYGQGILGGVDSSASAFAAFANPFTNAASFIGNLPSMGASSIESVAINDCGSALIGGEAGQAYAAFVDSATNSASPISGLPPGLSIHSVDLNILGEGLIGGDDGISVSYAAYVNVKSNVAMPLNTAGIELIQSVAINDAGVGLIGGTDANGAYAAYTILNQQNPIPIANLNLTSGSILSVAINDNGLGIVGGYDDLGRVFAAYVNPNTFTASPTILGLPIGASGSIQSVSINEFGQALIGGFESNGLSFAAFVDPSTNTATTLLGLPIIFGSSIQSVAILTHPGIPIRNLSGNNLVFANFINDNAKELAFYFLPSICSGNLDEALENALPLRNAVFLWTAERNVFVLNAGLSRYLRNARYARGWALEKGLSEICAKLSTSEYDVAASDLSSHQQENLPIASNIGLLNRKQKFHLGANQIKVQEKNKSQESFTSESRPYTLWLDGIGAFAFQKSQEDRVGFAPYLGGLVVGFDKVVASKSLVGGGAAYTFTELREEENQGHGHIHQEYFFVYAGWTDFGLYVDGAVWSGFFQISQMRNIHLKGFDFNAWSHPAGFELAPHIEIGYNKQKLSDGNLIVDLVCNPFIVLDWVNAWQQSYKEKGTGPFQFDQKSHYSSLCRMEAGFRLGEVFLFSSWRLIAEEKCAYANITSLGVGKMNVALLGVPGSFRVETFSKPQHLGVVEAALVFEPLSRIYPYGSISYQGEFGSSFQSHQIVGEVAWEF